MAEASNTTSFILCRLAPFRTQLFGKRDAFRYVLPDVILRALEAASHRRDAQFAVYDSQIEHPAHFHSESLAYRCGNNQATLLAQAYPSLRFHACTSSLECHYDITVA